MPFGSVPYASHSMLNKTTKSKFELTDDRVHECDGVAKCWGDENDRMTK